MEYGQSYPTRRWQQFRHFTRSRMHKSWVRPFWTSRLSYFDLAWYAFRGTCLKWICRVKKRWKWSRSGRRDDITIIVIGLRWDDSWNDASTWRNRFIMGLLHIVLQIDLLLSPKLFDGTLQAIPSLHLIFSSDISNFSQRWRVFRYILHRLRKFEVKQQNYKI